MTESILSPVALPRHALNTTETKEEVSSAPKQKKRRRNPLEVLEDNPTSLRAAINAIYWECQGSGEDPGIVDAIRNCTCGHICPAYRVRPYQKKRTQK